MMTALLAANCPVLEYIAFWIPSYSINSVWECRGDQDCGSAKGTQQSLFFVTLAYSKLAQVLTADHQVCRPRLGFVQGQDECCDLLVPSNARNFLHNYTYINVNFVWLTRFDQSIEIVTLNWTRLKKLELERTVISFQMLVWKSINQYRE